MKPILSQFKISTWTLLALVGLSSHSLISEFLRPNYKGEISLITYLLGVAPNFLAAGLIFPFGLLMIREAYTKHAKAINESSLETWFWTGLLGSQACLIIWEFLQQTGANLVYDVHDIGATLFGGFAAICTFYLIREKSLFGTSARQK